MQRTTARAFATAALLSILGCAGASAQHSSTFTYQGSLQHQGEPYTGTADFAFRLWDAETGGQGVSSLLLRDGVEVDQGLFQIPLDFGAEVLQDDRWMVISMRTPAWNGEGTEPPYTSLPGRQRIALSPYSVQTRGIFVNEAGDRVGIGTTDPQATLHVAGEVRAGEGVRFPGNGKISSLRLIGPFTLDPGVLPPEGLYIQILAAPGVLPGDYVIATSPYLVNFVLDTAQVHRDGNAIVASWRSVSGIAIDPPPFTASFLVIRP